MWFPFSLFRVRVKSTSPCLNVNIRLCVGKSGGAGGWLFVLGIGLPGPFLCPPLQFHTVERQCA